MNSMKESSYEIGTDEVAVKLGLSPRSVRRLGEKNILEGRVEITSVGKQWFFSRESVESLVSSYEAKRQKEERHRTAKDAFAGVLGQPRTTEDTSEASRPPPLSDEKRVEFLQGLLEQERKEHTETKEKLENKSAQLLEKAEVAARLEGEKMGFEKYVERLEIQQKQLMAMFKIHYNSSNHGQRTTTDTRPRTTEADPGQPRLRPRLCPNKNQNRKSPRWWGRLTIQRLRNRPRTNEAKTLHRRRGIPHLQSQNLTQRKILGQEREHRQLKTTARERKLSPRLTLRKLVYSNHARNKKQRHRNYTCWAAGRAERRGSIDAVGKS